MVEDQEEQAAASAGEEDMIRKISDIDKQNSLLLEQISDLSMAVYAQANQLKQNEDNLLKELKKFQSVGTQRAMGAIFYKLFRELLEHINRLDELLALHQGDEVGDSWLESISIVRDHFEKILADWGCKPVRIDIEKEQFDPEIHESVESADVVIPESVPENTIVKVTRRGWRLHDYVLQYPQVIVS